MTFANEQWCRAEAEAAGMDAAALQALETKLKGPFRNVDGIVIVRRGAIAFERCVRGLEPDTPRHVASVTKSVISALVGIAVDAGTIQSIDARVLDFFPEHSDCYRHPPAQSPTLGALLTMQAPFAWPSSARREPLDRLRRQRDWVRFILSVLGSNRESGKFHYNSLGPHLLSAILSKTTGTSAREFANRHLFRPLGMREIPDRDPGDYSTQNLFGENVTGWLKDPQGVTAGGWGLTLSLRDMARLGLLYLNGGRWANKRVLSEAWVRDSILPGADAYGYLWWLSGTGDAFTCFAAGHPGNYIFCTPAKDLVVAILSKPAARATDLWPLLAGSIFPAVVA